MIRHAIAVLIGYFRRPGRFSVYHYPRHGAIKRLESSNDGWVLDLGCGSRYLADHVVAVDLFPGKHVDIISDGGYLPFKDQVCDGVWLEAILEHVPQPSQILEEASRVLKPGGWLYCEVPFLQGEHAAPGDYRRWTCDGLLQMFSSWDLESIEPASGPFSALAYQLRSCLSLMTSFGSDFLYRIMFEAVWSYFVWPIKFLDIFFQSHSRAKEHAFGYAIMVRKKIEPSHELMNLAASNSFLGHSRARG